MTATPTERGSPLLAGRGAGALRARWRCVARSMRLPRAVIGIIREVGLAILPGKRNTPTVFLKLWD